MSEHHIFSWVLSLATADDFIEVVERMMRTAAYGVANFGANPARTEWKVEQFPSMPGNYFIRFDLHR